MFILDFKQNTLLTKYSNIMCIYQHFFHPNRLLLDDCAIDVHWCTHEADLNQATPQKSKAREKLYSFHFCLKVSDNTNFPVRDSGTEVAGSLLFAHWPSM